MNEGRQRPFAAIVQTHFDEHSLQTGDLLLFLNHRAQCPLRVKSGMTLATLSASGGFAAERRARKRSLSRSRNLRRYWRLAR